MVHLSLRYILLTALLCCVGQVKAQSSRRWSKTEPEVLSLEGDITPVHDPAIIRQGDTYYVFATNRFADKLTPIFCSQDLIHWKFCGHVFDAVPEWATREIPGARGIWAPDISYVDGKYLLYYSVSTFGSNHSAVGLITNKTLDVSSPDYKWIDQGLVVKSMNSDDWNAIDPNLTIDEAGNMWLVFGSFWSGIKIRRLDRRTGKPFPNDKTLYSLASRRPLDPPAIEAPYILHHDRYYYLFVSIDLCCRGTKSTYKVAVGRSKKITGPYVDRSGKLMMDGGGTVVLRGSQTWFGPGGQSILHDGDSDFLVFHSYFVSTGKAALQVSTIVWKEGWPVAGVLP